MLTKVTGNPIRKKSTFCYVVQSLIFFAFWTRGASLSMHRRQREMHVSGSMRTVKTFPFWADVPDTLEILLPDMLGDRRSR
jgi:hypothetical protein